MLSEKYARVTIQVLLLLLVGAISFFFVTTWIADTGFIQQSLESVEKSNQTVMKFSAATLSASLAISALPDDFATPLAESLTDMNGYFIAILIILFLRYFTGIYHPHPLCLYCWGIGCYHRETRLSQLRRSALCARSGSCLCCAV